MTPVSLEDIEFRRVLQTESENFWYKSTAHQNNAPFSLVFPVHTANHSNFAPVLSPNSALKLTNRLKKECRNFRWLPKLSRKDIFPPNLSMYALILSMYALNFSKSA